MPKIKLKTIIQLISLIIANLMISVSILYYLSNGNLKELIFNRLKEDVYAHFPISTKILIRKIKKRIQLHNYDKGDVKIQPLEKLSLTIAPRDMKKFQNQLKVAKERSVLIKTKTSEDWGKVQMRHQTKSYKGKIRLKGDWAWAINAQHPSFRVELKKVPWNGMKQFSLYKPKQRNYLGEWLFHYALRDENILSPRYEFVQLEINNIDRGVYAVEEFFRKEMLENMGRLDSVILKFKDDLQWKDLVFYNTKDADEFFSYPNKMTVEFFGNKKILKSSQLTKYMETAYSQYEKYSTHQISFCETFDCNLFAKYTALTDLFNASHGYGELNWRFYFNPLTTLFEPIGFDGNAFEPAKNSFLYSEIQNMNDDVLMQEYQKAIQYFSSDEYIESFWEKHEQMLGGLEQHLITDFDTKEMQKSHELKQIMKERAKRLKQIFHPPVLIDVRHHISQRKDEHLRKVQN